MTARTWPVLIAALAAGALGFWLGRPPPGLAPLASGAPMPEIGLSDLSGRPRTLGEWRGRPLLINFWASWCTPCIRELPLLAEFGREQSEIVVLAVALDDPAPVRALIDRLGIRDGLVPLLATQGDALVLLGNTRGAIPFSVLLDGQLRLRERHLGTVDRPLLERWRALHASSQSPAN